MRVGLLGGTFNPPHRGHLKLAELALAALGLDQVRFIPTALPPHKSVPALDPDGPARIRLLREALAGGAQPFQVETMEVDRGGTSYTVDTLELLAEREPGNGWIFLMGSDQLAGFPSWRRVDRILELASVAVAPRPQDASGERLALPGILAERLRARWTGRPGEVVWLPGTELDLASTALRAELGKGRIPDGIPAEVMAAILREKQYR